MSKNRNPMTVEQFLTKFPDATANDGCLTDIACPKCGHRDSFRIEITTVGDVDDEGSDANVSDHEWSGPSYIRCRQCDHIGTVHEFTVDGLDEAIEERSEIPDCNKP